MDLDKVNNDPVEVVLFNKKIKVTLGMSCNSNNDYIIIGYTKRQVRRWAEKLKEDSRFNNISYHRNKDNREYFVMFNYQEASV